jgi:hypothetical protein
MFDFLRNYIVVACGNYLRIVVNMRLKQQLCCIYVQMYKHAIMPHVHISITHYGIHLQLVFFIMIPMETISPATNVPLLKY